MKPHITNSVDTRPEGLDVQLLYGPIGLVSGVANRITEEGMHVDTGRIVLEHCSEVEITFPHRREDRTVYHRIIANVSRTAGSKTLLRFVRCSHDAHQALREVMASTAAQ